jgi:amidase
MSPLGLGNDGLGSLRLPAQCCGISVLRPTLGRIPRATTVGQPDVPISAQLMEVEGPLARRVADLRAALEVLAGHSWRDPWTVPAPLRSPEPTKPVRVALLTDPTGLGTAPQVKRPRFRARRDPRPRLQDGGQRAPGEHDAMAARRAARLSRHPAGCRVN